MGEQPAPHSLALISTGGTIAMVLDPGSGTPRPVLSGQELLDGLNVPDGTVGYYEPFAIGSEDVTFEHWRHLALQVQEALTKYDRVVVLHGTDTLAEGAFFLAETLNNPSVLLTGAMRPSGQTGEDGRRNIQDAVTVASQTNKLGVCVCMDGQVLPAWSVVKQDTVRTSAFGSREGARLGQVHDGKLRLASAPLTANWVARLPAHINAETIGIIPLAADPSVRQVQAVLDVSDGVIVEALATGWLPSVVRDQLLTAAKTKPVVLTSRVANGPVEASHDYPGVWDELRRYGILIEDHLDTYKARVRLALSMALQQPYEPFELRLPV